MSEIYQPKLMTIEEIKHYDKDGNCIWEEYDLPNIWHITGQQFVLSVAFDTDGDFSIPSSYYAGVDARSTLAGDDTLDSITDEPSTNGYARQAISSTTGFSVSLTGGVMKAVSGLIAFAASGGTWGPVTNMFFATTSDDSGTLITSVALSGSRIVAAGEILTVRVNLSLAGCP